MEQFFDPVKVVAHPELSLAGGAVRSWERRYRVTESKEKTENKPEQTGNKPGQS